jgi:hypothetical protein
MSANTKFLRRAVDCARIALETAIEEGMEVTVESGAEQVVIGQSHTIKGGGTFSLTLVATWTPPSEPEVVN